MKAPDKIYLHPDIGGREFIRPWLHRAANSESVVYIHKDALLEWAKEKQEQMKIEAGGCSNMLAAGKYLAYSELIEKIESL